METISKIVKDLTKYVAEDEGLDISLEENMEM